LDSSSEKNEDSPRFGTEDQAMNSSFSEHACQESVDVNAQKEEVKEEEKGKGALVPTGHQPQKKQNQGAAAVEEEKQEEQDVARVYPAWQR